MNFESIEKLDLEQIPDSSIVTEEEFKKLSHLPLQIVFYLSLQKEVSSTPVTPLELAAYLGIDVKITEEVLEFLEEKEIVCVFRDGMPAYSLAKDLNEISARSLIEIIGKCHEVLQREGLKSKGPAPSESKENYRKIYSELASEILTLFGQEAANDLPV